MDANSTCERHEITTSISRDTGTALLFTWHCSCGADGKSEWASGDAAERAGVREHLSEVGVKTAERIGRGRA